MLDVLCCIAFLVLFTSAKLRLEVNNSKLQETDMAAIFEYEKREPHVNYDDNFIISAGIIGDFLVLKYHFKDMSPLSVSLTSLTTQDCIQSVDFKEN